MQTRRSLMASAARIAAVWGCSFSLARNPLAFSATMRGHAHNHNKMKARTPTPESSIANVNESMANTLLGPVATTARWAYIVDDTTQTVLLEKDADQRMAPSSLTKMMTAYIVFAFLAAGRLKLEQTLPVSDKAWRTGGSKMFVPHGGNVSVFDLIQGMVIQSGNDACIVLAEGIAGSEENFAALMNQEAGRLGLSNSHFMNPTGLPADEHYMSARDIGILAGHLIRDFPQYYHFFGEKDFTFNGIHQGNRNVLVDKGLADGLKTGHTDAGGFGLCASALRNGRRVIMVINGTSSSNDRAHEGERLFQWAFNSFEMIDIFHKDQIVETNAAVWRGVKAMTSLKISKDLKVTLPIGWREQVKIRVAYPSPIPAPIQEGVKCGEVIVHLPYGSDRHIALLTAENVEKMNFIGRILSNFKH